MIELKDSEELNDIVVENSNVLLQFSAAWCGPCKQLSPILADLALENEDITVVKIDIDNHPGIASDRNITSVPTVIKIKDGGVIDTIVGVRLKDSYLFNGVENA